MGTLTVCVVLGLTAMAIVAYMESNGGARRWIEELFRED
jgi:hypothetical protein